MLTSAGLLILAIAGAPLFIVIAASGLLGFHSIGRPAADVTGEISKLTQSDALATIPLFTFAGYLLAESGAPRRLVAVTRALFGWAPGGMAVVTLFSCAFFTTFTGASGITIVALGGLLLPVLLSQGYPRQAALGLVATGGSRGLVFPPSLPVILYGYVASVDIGKLYVAGLLPGLINLGIIAAWCVRIGLVADVPRTPFVVKQALRAVWRALPELLLPFALATLLLTGLMTVPEAAALTALYVLIIETVIYRDVHPLRDLPRVTKESMVLCGAILIILAVSLGMTNYLIHRGIPQQIVAVMRDVVPNRWLLLLALNLFLLVVGCMMDVFSAIVVVVPLITPLAAEFGVHPVHLAIIFLINLELGYNTPPVGMNLFIASFRFRQSILRLYRASVPYLILGLIALLLITYYEPLSTFTLKERSSPATLDHSKRNTGTKRSRPKLDGLCEDENPEDPDCDDIDDIDIE